MLTHQIDDSNSQLCLGLGGLGLYPYLQVSYLILPPSLFSFLSLGSVSTVAAAASLQELLELLECPPADSGTMNTIIGTRSIEPTVAQSVDIKQVSATGREGDIGEQPAH
jgi:hypothetical protein